jgi:acyl-CoA synthetase (AMP-forming)/AMP-acid ligase II
VIDGIYRISSEGAPVFQQTPAPTMEALQALLVKIITRILRLLTRQGLLIEEQGMSYLAEPDAHNALTPLQAASCTYRIALGPRAGQKVLSMRSLAGTDQPSISGLCVFVDELPKNPYGKVLKRALRERIPAAVAPDSDN